jgi:hypothetical protein
MESLVHYEFCDMQQKFEAWWIVNVIRNVNTGTIYNKTIPKDSPPAV